ncbi:hypothetical protein Q8A67_022435 [Cirrhinus molitorella]|uniref:Uncharacterized protein n=1 Tax=Cirrhinus molitorella TaxID=172907 RepID=A0AA88TDG1_9TELE|nr:hypothetical protein Q8A67_022435 [Cirrhinus molitorella]
MGEEIGKEEIGKIKEKKKWGRMKGLPNTHSICMPFSPEHTGSLCAGEKKKEGEGKRDRRRKRERESNAPSKKGHS